MLRVKGCSGHEVKDIFEEKKHGKDDTNKNLGWTKIGRTKILVGQKCSFANAKLLPNKHQ